MSSNSIGILNTALQVSKKKLDLAIQNIANADNENYTAKVLDISELVVGNSPAGVQINKIRSNADVMLQKQLLGVNATSKYSSYISDLCKDVTDKLALPGKGSGLYSKLSEFSDAITTLSYNPTNPGSRNDLRDKADGLANYISSFAKYLQEQRYKADQDLYSAFTYVNSIISNLHDLNGKQMLFSDSSLEYAQVQDQIDTELSKLSEHFDIKHLKDDAGILHVYLKNGGREIVGKQRYFFDYTPMTTIQDFIDDHSLNPVFLVTRSLDGREEGRSIFIDGFKTSDLSYDLSSGAIDGFLQARDTLLPKIAETIDEIATKVADAFNTIHNRGNGSIAQRSLTGTTLVSASDKILGNGNMIINAMDSTGKPFISGDYGKIPALNLDLSKFTTNGIGGSFNLGGLADEINEYFAAASTGTRLEMNGLHTMNLAVTSSAKDGSNIALDLDLIPYSTASKVVGFSTQELSSVKMLVQSVDPATGKINLDFDLIAESFVNFKIANVTATGATVRLLGKSVDIAMNEHLRTGFKGGPSLELSNIQNYPITLSLDIETEVNGVTTTTTVQYTINSAVPVNHIIMPTSVPDTLEEVIDGSIDEIGLKMSHLSATDAAGNDVLQSSSNTDMTVKNGSHVRSGTIDGFSLQLNNTTAAFPITVSFEVQTLVNGVTRTSNVSYTITQPEQETLASLNGIINKRFTPNIITGDGRVERGGLSTPIIKAEIVDREGVPVTDPDQQGFLRILNTQTGGGVAVDQLESSVVSMGNKLITGGVSKAFGLNDAFVFKRDTPLKNKNIAVSMQLNNELKKSPEAFSIGKMQVYRGGEATFDSPSIFFAAGSGIQAL